MVVAVFLNHAAPIKELGHVPASCHAGVVLGYTLLAPAGAIIGVCKCAATAGAPLHPRAPHSATHV